MRNWLKVGIGAVVLTIVVWSTYEYDRTAHCLDVGCSAIGGGTPEEREELREKVGPPHIINGTPGFDAGRSTIILTMAAFIVVFGGVGLAVATIAKARSKRDTPVRPE